MMLGKKLLQFTGKSKRSDSRIGDDEHAAFPFFLQDIWNGFDTAYCFWSAVGKKRNRDFESRLKGTAIYFF